MKNSNGVFVSERTCVCCRRKAAKEEFLRIVRSKDGEICIDQKQRMEGRGAYICREGECVKLLQKKKGLERAFRCRVAPEVYERLMKELV